MKGFLTTIVSVLVFVVLVAGFLFKFDYLREIDLGFHDTYIVTNPIFIIGFVFIYLLFLVFLIKGIKQKMNSKEIVWPIAITNFLVLASFIFLMYLSYVMLALIHFDLLNQVDHSAYQNQKTMLIVTWLVPISGSALLEFFLVRKIVRLNAKRIR